MYLFSGLLKDFFGEKLADFWVITISGIIVVVVGALFIAVGRGIWHFFARRGRGSEQKAKQSIAPPPDAPAPDASPIAGDDIETTRIYERDEALISAIKAAVLEGEATSLVGLSGIGGIGKTEAAKVAARELRGEGHFRDGVVLVDLHGFAEGREPMSHEKALSLLLVEIGQPAPPPMPEDADIEVYIAEVSRIWRDVTRDRDLLVILDNARDEEQVRPLRPAPGKPRTLITSRAEISFDGEAQKIPVEEMGPVHARTLIQRLAPRLAEPEIERLVDLSLGLPLLIRALALLIEKGMALSPEEWLDRIKDAGADLPVGDVRQVKARLGVSVDALGEANLPRYAALSLFPSGFHAKSANALWEVEDVEGADILSRFSEQSLLIPIESDFAEMFGPRYRLHDYLQAVAADQFRALADRERTGFRHRWGQEALKLLEVADDLYRSKGGDLPGLRLFEQEQGTIAAAQGWAAARAGEDDAAADLAMSFPNFPIHGLRLTPRQWIGWLEAGLPAAKRLKDRRGEAAILGNLGDRLRHLGDLDAAEARHKQSLAIETELGNKQGIATDYNNLGIVYEEQGKFEDAEAAFKASLETMDQLNDDTGMAHVFGSLGVLYSAQKRFDDAEKMFLKSLTITEDLGLREVSAKCYSNLGNLYQKQGKLDQAGEAYAKSLAIETDLGHRDGMATNNFNLAILRAQQGRFPEARQHAETARALYAEMGMDRDVTKADALLEQIDAAMHG